MLIVSAMVSAGAIEQTVKDECHRQCLLLTERAFVKGPGFSQKLLCGVWPKSESYYRN